MRNRKEHDLEAANPQMDSEESKKEMGFLGYLSSYIPSFVTVPSLSSMQEAYSDLKKVVTPYVKKENSTEMSVAVLSNVVLPVVSAIVTSQLIEHANQQEEENGSFNAQLAFAALIPAAALSLREAVNNSVVKSLTHEMRSDFRDKLKEDNVLSLKDHSPHQIKDLPTASEIIITETESFSKSALPITIGLAGNAVDFLSMVYSGSAMVGANTALSMGGAAVAVALLNAKVGNMNSAISKENKTLEEGLAGRLRYDEKNKQQIVALNSQRFELEHVDELMEKQVETKLQNSTMESLGYMTNMFIYFAAPQILRSFTSIYPEGTTKDDINSFSSQATQSMHAVGSMVRPLTQGRIDYDRGMERLLQLHKIIDDVNDFKEQSPLKINYSGASESIEFSNFSLAKPSEEKHESLMEKVQDSLVDDKLTSLRDADMSLQNGKIYRLLGESGLGKSTLLKACSGSWPYASGNITFPCKKEEVYFMSQKTMEPYKRTLLGEMVYPRNESTIRADEKEKLTGLMERLGLSERVVDLENPDKKDWSILSGGEQQRMALIRMIMADPKPKVLLMDEVTSSVDPEKTQVMKDLIKEHLPQATILYISHETSTQEVQSFEDETITINKQTGQFELSNNAACMTRREDPQASNLAHELEEWISENQHAAQGFKENTLQSENSFQASHEGQSKSESVRGI